MQETRESEFEFISDLCTVLAEKSELQPILDWLVHKSTNLLNADDCSIKLLDPGAGTTRTFSADSRRPRLEAGAASWPRVLKDSVMGYLLAHGGEVATPDLRSDPRFPAFKNQDVAVRALLAVPLKVDGRITGMLAASNTRPGRDWSRHEIQLLSIIASHSAGVIEKARLRLEEEKKDRLELEKQAMDKELIVASQIQMRLVPPGPLRMGAWQIEGRLVPAKQVGGDFYDYFELADGRVVFTLADVAGKGIPAALLVSTVHTALRAFAEGSRGPSHVMEQLNRTVLRASAAGKFVTLFYGELTSGTGELAYANAGHLYPRIRHVDGGVDQLCVGGVPLGLFDDVRYETSRMKLDPRDSLFLMSDGIPEAMDTHQHDFGEERMDALWREHGGGATATALECIMRAVHEFRGRAPQSDDETALVIAPWT